MNLRPLAIGSLLLFLFLPSLTQAQMPQFGHVIVVMFENEDYSMMIGSSSMPYLNSLAGQYGLATNYYANAHYSIGNYFMATTGELVTDDDGFTCWVTIDNIVRDLLNSGTGKTWKAYAESLPYAGYTGASSYPYARNHNPFVFFQEVQGNATQKMNVVPLTQYVSDLNGGTLPNFSWLIPNQQNNMHDCPAGITNCTNSDKLANADHWLQTNIAPLLASPQFQQDGLLIITVDEATLDDYNHGGGRVATVIVSPKVKPAYQSSTFFQHGSILRTVEEALGLNVLPGVSQFVPDFAEFFTSGTAGSISGTVTDSSTGAPIPGATVAGPGQTTTAANGSYTLSPVSPGTYTVSASANGYQGSSESASVTAGTTSSLNFALAQALNGSLVGKVTSVIDGHTLSGTTVSYSGGSAVTDSTGTYQIPSVAPGAYNVSTSKSGWLPETETANIGGGSQSTLNFAISTAGIIKGAVSTAAGAGIPGATVTVSGGVIATNKSLTTSSAGAYSSNWIPVGSYTVTATTSGGSQSKTVTLGTGQTVAVNFTF